MSPDANEVLKTSGASVLRAAVDANRRTPGREQGMRPVSAPKPKTQLQVYSAAELKGMIFPPVRWIVSGYLPEGLTLLAAKPKAKKSWLMLDISIAVARGGYVLGGIKCGEGDVLYADLESNKRRAQNRVQKLIPHHDSEWPARLAFVHDMPRGAEGVAAIRGWIETAANPRLVIIDTLAKIKPAGGKTETNYEADYSFITPLQRLASEFNIAIVLVHHVRKMDSDDPFDTVSGTLGLTGAADSILILKRTGQGVTLHGQGRDIEELEIAMRFNTNTCRWEPLGEASEAFQSDERTLIINTIRDNGEPMAPAEIAAVTGMKSGNLYKLLHQMKKAGSVEKRGRCFTLPDQDGENEKTQNAILATLASATEPMSVDALKQIIGIPNIAVAKAALDMVKDGRLVKVKAGKGFRYRLRGPEDIDGEEDEAPDGSSEMPAPGGLLGKAMRNSVLNALRKRKKALSKTEVEKALGIKDGNLHPDFLPAMVAEGILVTLPNESGGMMSDRYDLPADERGAVQ